MRQGLLRAMAQGNKGKHTGGEETHHCPWRSPKGENPGAQTHAKTRMKTL